MGPWRPSCCYNPSLQSLSQLGRQDRILCPSSVGKPQMSFYVLSDQERLLAPTFSGPKKQQKMDHKKNLPYL